MTLPTSETKSLEENKGAISMNQTWDYRTLIPTLIAQINTFLMLMGVYHLANDQLNAILAILSSIFGLVGIFLSHKTATTDGESQ